MAKKRSRKTRAKILGLIWGTWEARNELKEPKTDQKEVQKNTCKILDFIWGAWDAGKDLGEPKTGQKGRPEKHTLNFWT